MIIFTEEVLERALDRRITLSFGLIMKGRSSLAVPQPVAELANGYNLFHFGY